MARQSQREEPDATPPALPPPSGRTRRGGERTQVLEFELQTVTPVYGGGARLQQLDERSPVRAASIAAQVRAWWRVLEAPAHETAHHLRERESELWGSVHGGDPRRSLVDVWVTAIRGAERDTSSVDDDAYSYALWPAKPPSDGGQRRAGDAGDKPTPWAPRWKPGLTFTLHLRAPASRAVEVERAVKAWVLFGGYGARTRRGCGALTAPGAGWLPATAQQAAIETALGLAAGALSATGAAVSARDTPTLPGSLFACGRPSKGDAEWNRAWKVALRWLREFRQERGTSGWHARGQGSGNRPGRSRWPEPDKIRNLGAHRDGHEAHYRREPAWPRAQLGLPIVFSAWDKSLSLVWSQGGKPFERLASPLIVKPLPLADASFAPLALWLHRAHPRDAQVGLAKGRRNGQPEIVAKSQAPFERLLGGGDEPLFEPLRGARSLREAFFRWLHERHASDATVWP